MNAQNEPEASSSSEQTNSTLPCLLCMLTVSALWGFCSGFLPENSSFLVFLTNAAPILLLSCAVIWCYLDSCRYDTFLHRKFYLCLFLCFAVAYPYYVFRTRGLSGFITLGGSFIFMTTCCIFALVGAGLGCALATAG